MKGSSMRGRSNTSGSTTSNQTRPLSRASTTSVNTTDENLAQTLEHAPDASQRTIATVSIGGIAKYSPEEMITRSQQQLTNPNQAYAIDPSLQRPAQPDSKSDMELEPNGLPDATLQPHIQLQSFQDREGQSFFSVNEGLPDNAGGGDVKVKKGSASSIANDQELKRLYQENKTRTLRNVADSVLQEERGPRSEKTKQIFAMIWLSTVCRKGSNSVPRNRVFSYYATRCGNERVPPLNPASFGKLVRIIFPGIQTRRLGMRGESKYHYVDLEMVEDAPECRPDNGIAHFEGYAGRTSEGENFPRPRPHPPADTAVFPPPNLSTNDDSADPAPPNLASASKGNLYLAPNLSAVHQGPAPPNMASRQLKFPTDSDLPEQDQQEIELPSLHGFMPNGTDSDAADALRALYRTHCIAVIDGFRYCKEKSFYHSFTSFHGTLTVPVQKLLAYPGLASWIKECDWLMYQKMIRFVAPLALQAMPVRVIDTFRTISQRLGPHILNTFQHHPAHVRDARHGPAIIFASLLDRLLRVNATAHAAANILTDSTSRNQMWFDWVYCVRPTTVVETSLPGMGYTRTVQILTNEIRELLGPLSCVKYDGMQPIFAAVADDHKAEIAQQMQTQLDSSSTESVLDRWNNFLTSLPSRFPDTDARTLIHCVGAVSSAALRDITMADAKSFGYWCVTKTWVEEMLQWLAEKGGFLEGSPNTMVMRPQKRTAQSAGFDFDEETDPVYSRPRTGFSEATDRQNHYGSPVMMQSFDNVQNNALFPPQDAGFRPHPDGNFQQPNSHQNTDYNHPPSTHRTTQDVQYGPNGMIIRNGNYSGSVTHQQPMYKPQPPQNQPPPPRPLMDKAPMLPPQLAKEAETQDNDHNNDDSGIGLDLELPPQRTPNRVDYNVFMNNNSTASDPADVVVC